MQYKTIFINNKQDG